MSKVMKLSQVIGGGYDKFWRYRGRYRVCKGSRASKKSKTTALWYIWHIMKHPGSNLLCVRKTLGSLYGSSFTELKWAIHRLGVDNLWKIRNNPMELIYLPTKQRIIFRGLDDPLKITSITVDVGVLCWMWIEEAYEIDDEADFDMLDESIRGDVPEGLWKQITITFNPWNATHWLKRRFFDIEDDNILAMTTNYMCNEWLDENDLRLFEDMKKHRPKRYEVAGLGNWGMTDGVIFENWEVADLSEMSKSFANRYFGLDFGTSDPNALICIDIEIGQKKIYIYDEFYQGNITLDILANAVRTRIGNSYVTCDSAGAQHILELNNTYGLWCLPAKKGADSIGFGINWLEGFDLVVDKHCVNFIREISNYVWAKDKFGNMTNRPVDANNHLIDALRYACEPVMHDNRMESTRRLF